MLRRSERLLLVVPLVLSCLLASSLAGATAPRMEVQARVQGADGLRERTITPGTMLSSADAVRLRITANEPGYLYVVAIGSSGSALLLHPFGAAAPSPVRAGDVLAVPQDGGYLPLDDQPGTESLVAFVTPGVETSLPALLARLEDARAAGRGLSEALGAQGHEAAVSSFGHAPSLIADAAGSPATGGTGSSDGKGVLSGLGSRIASFTGAGGGAEAGATAAAPAATTAAAEDAVPSRDVPVSQEHASGGFLSGITGLFGQSADEQRSEAAVVAGTAAPGDEANTVAARTLPEIDSAPAPAPQPRPVASAPVPPSSAVSDAMEQEPSSAVGLPPQAAASNAARGAAIDRPRLAAATGPVGVAPSGAPRPTGRFVQPLAIEATMSPTGVSAEPAGAVAPAGGVPSPPEPRPGGRVEGTLARLFEGGPPAAAAQPATESSRAAPAETSFAEDASGLPPVETREAEAERELGLLSTLQELLGVGDPQRASVPAPVQSAPAPAPADASSGTPGAEPPTGTAPSSPADPEPAPGVRREPGGAPSSGSTAIPGNSSSSDLTQEQARGGSFLAGLASLFGGNEEVAATGPASPDEPEEEAATIIAAGESGAEAGAAAGFTVESTTSVPASVPARTDVSRAVPESASPRAASPAGLPREAAADGVATGGEDAAGFSGAGVETPGGPGKETQAAQREGGGVEPSRPSATGTAVSPAPAVQSNEDADATVGLLARLFGGGSPEPVSAQERAAGQSGSPATVSGAASVSAVAADPAETSDSQAPDSVADAPAVQQQPAGGTSWAAAGGAGAGSQDSLALQQKADAAARVETAGVAAAGTAVDARADATVTAGRLREQRNDGAEPSSESGGLLSTLGALFSGGSEPGPADAIPAASYPAKGARTEPETAAGVAASSPVSTPMHAGGSPAPASPARGDSGGEPILTRATDDAGRSQVRLEGGRPPTPQGGGNDEVLSAAGSRIRALLDGPDSDMAGIAALDPASSSGSGAVPAVPGADPDAADGLAMAAAPGAATVALAQLDLDSGDGPAGAVVLVVTASGTAGGVLVDMQGHVLTRWHEVREHDSVTVVFRRAGAPGSATVDRQRARLVAHSKFADLALLRVDAVPPDHRPAVLAADTEALDGASLHAVALTEDGSWQQGVARDARVLRNSSWYSPYRVLHRADVIRARVGGAAAAAAAGSVLFNERMELVGLAAVVRADRGELIGVSAATLRAFLEGTG